MTPRLAIPLAVILTASCHKSAPVPTPQNSGTVASVGVSPYDIVSPFLCRISTTELSCMATTDVRFRRGQLEAQFARGYQFTFRSPKGAKGTGVVWFGCAGVNECGPGYFMLGSNTFTVDSVEPARYWNGLTTLLVPHGSLGIAEVDVANDQFVQIRNRWTGSIAPPLLKQGKGVIVTCTDLACTVSLP